MAENGHKSCELYNRYTQEKAWKQGEMQMVRVGLVGVGFMGMSH
jgi:hypothetical protein